VSFPYISLIIYLFFKSAVVPDDFDLVRDGPNSPQDRTSSPCPDEDPQSDPQPQPPVPAPARRRAVAQIRPISIADLARDVAGPDPMRVVREFDRVYMPEGMCVVNSAVDGQPGEDRRSEIKRKAENISRSYCEVFAMLTSGNSSHAEAARILKTITNVTPVVFLFHLSIPLTRCLY